MDLEDIMNTITCNGIERTVMIFYGKIYKMFSINPLFTIQDVTLFPCYPVISEKNIVGMTRIFESRTLF